MITPEQAIQLLDQVTAEVEVNRMTHFQIQTALASLSNAVAALRVYEKPDNLCEMPNPVPQGATVMR